MEISWKKNLGNTDRVLRILLGTLLYFDAVKKSRTSLHIRRGMGILTVIEGIMGY